MTDEFTVEQIHTCTIPLEYLTDPWDDLPEDVKTYISNHLHGLPCEGGGTPGSWCTASVMRSCKWYRDDSW